MFEAETDSEEEKEYYTSRCISILVHLSLSAMSDM